jgi:predicted DNA-binding transcriptional regulator AlpA
MEKITITTLTLVFVRVRYVRPLYGVSRQTIWRYVRAGRVPRPTVISAGVVGWERSVLDSFFCKAPQSSCGTNLAIKRELEGFVLDRTQVLGK